MARHEHGQGKAEGGAPETIEELRVRLSLVEAENRNLIANIPRTRGITLAAGVWEMAKRLAAAERKSIPQLFDALIRERFSSGA